MNASNLTFQYIRDAAQFRLQLEPWVIDKNYETEGGAIYYAVDTDIIKLYSDPQKRIKYAHVFSTDTPKTKEIIAWALGQFIFFSLTGKDPLLVIPPHHMELERVITGIACDAAREREEVLNFLPQIKRAIGNYRETKNISALLELFQKKPLALINYAYGGRKGFNAELDRITTLLADIRLQYIDRYVDHNKGNQTTLPLLQDDVKAEDYYALKELTQNWVTRLRLSKSKSKSSVLISDDAEVLARLEWINNELKGEQKKLVLISGDQALHSAASEYLIDDNTSFADFYIRNPLVFLAAPGFLSSCHKRETVTSTRYNNGVVKLGLLKWFDVFLAQYKPDQKGYTKRLEEITAINDEKRQQQYVKNFMTDEEGQNSLQDLIADWQQFVQLTGFAHSFEGGDNISILEQIGAEDFNELREKIVQKADEVWKSFLKSATEVGFWSTNAFEKKLERDTFRLLPLRGIPAPRFTLEPVCTHIKKLCLTLQHGPITRREISFDGLLEKDKSGYSAFFLFSLAFGAAGRWGVSRTLAKHALDISDHLEPDQQLHPDLEPISGNEAAYLLAWAIRHSVKKVDMLEEGIEYLKEAIHRKAKAVGGDGSDIRYSSEYIAIHMTCHFFRIFTNQFFSGEVPSLEDCHKTIIKFLNQLNQDKDEEEHIRRTVKKQLFVYLFGSYLLRHFKEKSSVPPEQKEELLNLLPDFQKLLESQEPPTRTCFTQPVYWAACVTLSKNQELIRECKREAEIVFQKKEMHLKRCSVMPYDESLYDFLYNLACNPSSTADK